jgi:DNA-binding transcriptional LysR family regulator
MNINRINLNLLKVFAVLMQEQHVTAAAKRLYITQSAVSNSLQQLRELFQDELLIRGPKKMVPTQKAMYLAPQVEQIIRQLETLFFYTDEFDYQTSTRTFHLGMTDYAEYVLLPKIYDQIRKIAPHLSLKVLSYYEFSPEDFENGQLEIGIGLEKQYPKPLVMERLFSDRPVCVAREDHPIFTEPFTLERYLQAEHLATCKFSEETLPLADKALQKLNLSRHIKLSLPNGIPSLQTISTSDLIGTFSQNIVIEAEKRFPLKHITAPFDIPEYHVAQIWHRQQDNDQGLIWLRTLIKNISDQNFNNNHLK